MHLQLFCNYCGVLDSRISSTIFEFCIFTGNKKTDNIAGAKSWNQKSRKAYGICMSLYDQHPINGKISGSSVFCLIHMPRLHLSEIFVREKSLKINFVLFRVIFITLLNLFSNDLAITFQ